MHKHIEQEQRSWTISVSKEIPPSFIPVSTLQNSWFLNPFSICSCGSTCSLPFLNKLYYLIIFIHFVLCLPLFYREGSLFILLLLSYPFHILVSLELLYLLLCCMWAKRSDLKRISCSLCSFVMRLQSGPDWSRMRYLLKLSWNYLMTRLHNIYKKMKTCTN